jgi:hypothetical protein
MLQKKKQRPQKFCFSCCKDYLLIRKSFKLFLCTKSNVYTNSFWQKFFSLFFSRSIFKFYKGHKKSSLKQKISWQKISIFNMVTKEITISFGFKMILKLIKIFSLKGLFLIQNWHCQDFQKLSNLSFKRLIRGLIR